MNQSESKDTCLNIQLYGAFPRYYCVAVAVFLISLFVAPSVVFAQSETTTNIVAIGDGRLWEGTTATPCVSKTIQASPSVSCSGLDFPDLVASWYGEAYLQDLGSQSASVKYIISNELAKMNKLGDIIIVLAPHIDITTPGSQINQTYVTNVNLLLSKLVAAYPGKPILVVNPLNWAYWKKPYTVTLDQTSQQAIKVWDDAAAAYGLPVIDAACNAQYEGGWGNRLHYFDDFGHQAIADLIENTLTALPAIPQGQVCPPYFNG